MTALRRLLTDPEPWKRSAAARALLAMDDERVRDVALSLIDGPDGALRAPARGWLVFRCTTAMLPLLESRVPRSLAGKLCSENVGARRRF
jgi:hypothetical protein